ncbi:hypothetical protein TVAG_392950 [Trichomonas vaginalis G3]|uniref:Uncharacterized protein n=1 Tax=Trichomonas vaginalis (strain ATCC PRA-98 / G3) TaxID=412133 RepID=A2DY91_TRIV3|nr:phospholipase C/P1 nuclease family [Trichomonas vaginalis G3]EAY14568.1 hypothetical protein TVAG_392950 [Trichomonas vaginalis G3]KAI5526578.1 phospholipase C/P1 nuclease family [Trichomonas vaginalis G3]|eukprot:XP_001326791.1 hypothetical protein [Trichomonas vaginalis G3]
MLSIFLAHSLSWNDEALTVAMEVYFRGTGDDGKNFIKQLLSITGENLDRLSLFGSWIDYVERAPFNTKCFNHWRSTKKGIPKGSKNYTTEDLDSMLASFEKSLLPQTITGAWTTITAYKSYFALYLEAFDPTNVANYHSDQFIDGDNNGRDFIVEYNGSKKIFMISGDHYADN